MIRFHELTAPGKEKMKEQVLFEKYRLVKLLSNGIGGEVWLAEHTRLSAYRVIKCLYKKQPFYKDLLQEAQILKQFTKPFLPQIYDIEEDEEASYIIEEYLSGETLKDFILRQKCLPELQILQYSIQLCEIISYLHSEAAGVVHLDLKPENLLVEEDALRMIDFGSARFVKEDKRRCSFATRGYAAPEQYEDCVPDVRADIYGIGKLLQFMLANSKGYDKRLNRIVAQCTKQKPTERYKNVLEVKKELEALLPGEGKRTNRKRRNMDTNILLGVAALENIEDSFIVSVLFAGYFRELTGKRIALLDLSDSRKIACLQEVFSDSKQLHGERMGFLLHGVAYYSEVGVSEIGKCLAEGYDVLVLHFGISTERYLTEFLRCETSYVVGSAMPWQLSAWEGLERLFRTGGKKQVTALITAGYPEELDNGMWKDVVSLPAVKDVFLPRGEMAKCLKHLLFNQIK